MNNKVETKELEKYFSETRTWETDKVRQAEDSKKLAWRVASVASAFAALAVVAITGLTPLKTVEPYVIRVDSTTGVVDVVEALRDGKTNYEETINKYFVQWYVRYREGYSRELADEYYSNVGIMSVGTEQQKYFEWFTPKNPASPLNVYGTNAKVKISIKGTSLIKPNVALVRYTKAIERLNDKPQLTHWAASITFKYSGAPMKERDRAVNPLGFQVVEYRNDPDSLVATEGIVSTVKKGVAAAASAITVFPSQPVSASAPVVPAIEAEGARQ